MSDFFTMFLMASFFGQLAGKYLGDTRNPLRNTILAAIAPFAVEFVFSDLFGFEPNGILIILVAYFVGTCVLIMLWNLLVEVSGVKEADK